MAKTTPPIKTDLFRFVTFRSPEELTFDTKALRFVIHPNIHKSLLSSCPIRTTRDKDNSTFDKYISKFPRFTSKGDLQKINPELFEFSNTAFKRKTAINMLITESVNPPKELSLDDVTLLFEALMGEVLSKKSQIVRQAIANMLIVNHALKHHGKFESIGIKKLTDIKIEIPYELIRCYKPWFFKDCGGSLEGVQNLGVADFRRVEQEVCCYVPGEVSHIENIMAKEYKERSTRNYVRTENTIETSRETEVESLSDTTTATRNELNSEVANVIQEDKSSAYGGSLGVSGKIGTAVEINVDAYADFTNSNSSSYSNSQARSYAEEVTQRALERIVQRTSERRTSKVIKEFEENNKHGFDNRGDAAQHVTGIYRWIDIIYTNRLINYGKRLMVEFMVPEPAEFYKTILNYKKVDSSEEESNTPEAPLTLEHFRITKPGDITSLDIANAASYYGVNIDPLPPSNIDLTMSLNPPGPVDHNRSVNSQPLPNIGVPPKYEADIVLGSYTYVYRANSASSSQQAFCDFTFGGKIVYSGKDYNKNKTTKNVDVDLNLNPNLPGNIPVSVNYSGCFGMYGAVTIKCVLKQSTITDWQSEAYNKLVAAYNQKLDQYNAEVQANEQEGQTNESNNESISNPAMNRIIEQRELKRICIEMLMKPFCNVQGRDNNVEINACDLYQIPQVNQNQTFSEYARTVKFFEQAIDWKIMSYLFYPYYWAEKCDWADLMQSESDDLIFQAFLQSGMGRVVVPIREQFTEAFSFYIETGDIWLSNDLVAGSEGDLYLSIAEDMQTIEGNVEDVWESRVPTSLAIIQGKSAFLEEEGLPCCHIVENDNTTSNISGTDATLKLINPE